MCTNAAVRAILDYQSQRRRRREQVPAGQEPLTPQGFPGRFRRLIRPHYYNIPRRGKQLFSPAVRVFSPSFSYFTGAERFPPRSNKNPIWSARNDVTEPLPANRGRTGDGRLFFACAFFRPGGGGPLCRARRRRRGRTRRGGGGRRHRRALCHRGSYIFFKKEHHRNYGRKIEDHPPGRTQ